jgi:hypothetical protein
MPEAQHGRHCGCAECVLSVQRRAPAVVPWRETATLEQLRNSYEAALDEMQRLCEAHPAAHVFDPLRTFLTEAGRKLR